jgi:Sulfatase-modifying factor enzyme 1
MKNKILLTIAILIGMAKVSANNIQTANVSLTGQNTGSHFTLIGFDISWENSWRTSTNESNYDGAWIFAKFRKKNTSLWQHATLNYVSPGTPAACGHTAAAGVTLQTSSDAKGVWMYRDADGLGSVSWTDNKLRWNYGADGVLDADSVEIRLYAVELVYIPQGAYYLGSGSTTETARFRDGASDTYLNITSENAITVGTAAGNIFGYGSTDMSAGSIPAAYPKGYNAFWIMKHEMSQQCYVDFLNTLDLAGNTARNIGGFTGTHPALVAPFPERAIENVSSTDLLSWLDWAAMRPFTEMEYEKACRGANITPVANEYAWGNTALTAIGTATNSGTNNEGFSVGNCNYYYYTITRPMRVGALATLTSTRISSGATYYGVMEMSGNVYERAIAAGYTQGRAFNGLHGDGKLSTSFNYNVANWPVGGSGLTFKGGSWGLNTPGGYATLTVSDRASASTVNDTRGLAYGGRGARTAE